MYLLPQIWIQRVLSYDFSQLHDSAPLCPSVSIGQLFPLIFILFTKKMLKLLLNVIRIGFLLLVLMAIPSSVPVFHLFCVFKKYIFLLILTIYYDKLVPMISTTKKIILRKKLLCGFSTLSYSHVRSSVYELQLISYKKDL